LWKIIRIGPFPLLHVASSLHSSKLLHFTPKLLSYWRISKPLYTKKKMRNIENEQWNIGKTQIHSEKGSL